MGQQAQRAADVLEQQQQVLVEAPVLLGLGMDQQATAADRIAQAGDSGDHIQQQGSVVPPVNPSGSASSKRLSSVCWRLAPHRIDHGAEVCPPGRWRGKTLLRSLAISGLFEAFETPHVVCREPQVCRGAPTNRPSSTAFGHGSSAEQEAIQTSKPLKIAIKTHQAPAIGDRQGALKPRLRALAPRRCAATA